MTKESCQEKYKSECCECVQGGGTVCCYCMAGPNVFCLTEDFNLTPEAVAKVRSEENDDE